MAIRIAGTVWGRIAEGKSALVGAALGADTSATELAPPAEGRYALIGNVGNSPLFTSNGPIDELRSSEIVIYARIHESSNLENFSSLKIFPDVFTNSVHP